MENPRNLLLTVQDPSAGEGVAAAKPLAEAPGRWGAEMADFWTDYTDPVTIGWLVGYGALVWILLCAPLMGAKGRKRGAALLGILGFVPIAMLAIQWRTHRTLEVINPFLRGEEQKPFFFITDVAEAPGWQWPLVVLAALWLPALMIWMRANRKPAAPQPIWYAFLLGVWFIGLRVGVELTAGPAELDFATRITFFVVHLGPFAAYYAGRRGAGFIGLLLTLLLANLVVRALLIGWGWAATEYELGSWVDANAITDFNAPIPLWGDVEVDLRDGSPTDRWTSAILIPQLLFAAALTVPALVLGLVPYLLGRRNPDV